MARFWFFTVVEPETNYLLHIGLYVQQTIVRQECFSWIEETSLD